MTTVYCPHIEAERAERRAAWMAAHPSEEYYREPAPYRYCGPCWAAHLAEGLTAEDWADLHRMAAEGRGSRSDTLPGLRRLPTPPKVPHHKAADVLERATALVAKHLKAAGGSSGCQRQLGKGTGDGWQVHATDGCIAVLVPGPGSVQPPLHSLQLPQYQLELPPAFALAFARVRTCAHERSHAIKIRKQGAVLTLSAGDWDTEATETLRLTPEVEWPGEDGSPDFGVCLDADYIHVCLGVWPLSLYYPAPGPPLPGEELEYLTYPVTFAASGVRIVVMPMRVG